MTKEGLKKETILTAAEIQAALKRISSEILAQADTATPVVIVGIKNRGVPLAERVAKIVKKDLPNLELGSLDISLYRDDLDNLGSIASIQSTELPHDINGKRVILCDDVLFTGRTIRAAIDAVMDFGRPSRIELAVLVDRGNRELPIAANYCGHQLETTHEDYISVRLKETDDEEGVFLLND